MSFPILGVSVFEEYQSWKSPENKCSSKINVSNCKLSCDMYARDFQQVWVSLFSFSSFQNLTVYIISQNQHFQVASREFLQLFQIIIWNGIGTDWTIPQGSTSCTQYQFIGDDVILLLMIWLFPTSVRNFSAKANVMIVFILFCVCPMSLLPTGLKSADYRAIFSHPTSSSQFAIAA